jgi:hypothetical protein
VKIFRCWPWLGMGHVLRGIAATPTNAVLELKCADSSVKDLIVESATFDRWYRACIHWYAR